MLVVSYQRGSHLVLAAPYPFLPYSLERRGESSVLGFLLSKGLEKHLGHSLVCPQLRPGSEMPGCPSQDP